MSLRHLAGCTESPSGAWVTQQARQLAWTLTERSTPVRFLIRDRDSTFSRDFDTIFRGEGLEIIRTPVRAPKANAIAERFVRTIRAECLDWLLILNVGRRPSRVAVRKRKEAITGEEKVLRYPRRSERGEGWSDRL